ncbi:hypothetical protein [Gordonia sp. OPL2]|uniref:hypothetical protein n=1 Tax=Gordonia sp. OPL2 TaxID=2486274 RepID=UPI0016566072|nr:hypothetical protein [Gordonia sp. OPL2]RPA06188.1 hypothetical protein EEB19_09985 [Gordonia sp. OPL2]
MSDNWIEFFSLDADEREAAQLIYAQVQWLLDREIIAHSERPDEFHGTYREGPRSVDAFDAASIPDSIGASGEQMLFGGVRVEHGWQVSHNIDGFEGPPCPVCGSWMAIDVAGDALRRWYMSRVEPEVNCASCGQADLLGNWPHKFAGYANYASLSFVNSWPLAPHFERELLERIGRRPGVVCVRL